MGHPFLPLTDEERRQMHKTIGIERIEELFKVIPSSIQESAFFDLPAYNETETVKLFTQWAEMNTPASKMVSFLGAGAYEHAIPAAVKHLATQSEFLTAYTPYQPEMNQGILQAFFEYQSLIADLTGMDVANASMYDGPTALAEAVLLAGNFTRRREILVFPGLNPEAQQVLEAYTRYTNLRLKFLSPTAELTAPPASFLNEQTAAVVIQNPDFFGQLVLTKELLTAIKEKGALSIVYVNDPISLAILEPPGTLGADLVVGEAQAFGLPLSFGGPYLGFLAAQKTFLRSLPGRLVGKTTDLEGKEGFVLTLQTREQHIRRERATSNICSNQALCAIMATIYLSLLGPVGLQEVAWSTVRNSHYLFSQLTRIPSVKAYFDAPFFHEFALDLGTLPPDFFTKMKERGFFPGYDLSHYSPPLSGGLLLYTSELRTKDEMDKFCAEMEDCLS
ncbi:MAG: aminomethyl-transferring glycine dehydrogenase subunit GcvPA [Firmicutes bacterium]|nr:aminomethyl-transferring glycine dehydrogenase subunit GcvPA [Bacillota bacterium]